MVLLLKSSLVNKQSALFLCVQKIFCNCLSLNDSISESAIVLSSCNKFQLVVLSLHIYKEFFIKKNCRQKRFYLLYVLLLKIRKILLNLQQT